MQVRARAWGEDRPSEWQMQERKRQGNSLTQPGPAFARHLKCIFAVQERCSTQDRIEHTCVSSLSASIKSPFIIITLFAFSFHCEPCLPDLACSMDYTRKRRRSWLNTTAAWDNKRILDFENWLWSHLLCPAHSTFYTLHSANYCHSYREMQMTGKNTQKSTLGAVISFRLETLCVTQWTNLVT